MLAFLSGEPISASAQTSNPFCFRGLCPLDPQHGTAPVLRWGPWRPPNPQCHLLTFILRLLQIILTTLPIEHQPNMIYKIPCADCDWCYVGETGRCFETHKKEHIRSVKTCANGSNIAKHAWPFSHRIDFNHSRVIDKGSFRIRKTLEACHTSATKHAVNNSKPIPHQYSILFKQ